MGGMSSLSHQQLFEKVNQKWLADSFGKWLLSFSSKCMWVLLYLLAVLWPPFTGVQWQGPNQTQGLDTATLTVFQGTIQRKSWKIWFPEKKKKNNKPQASKVFGLKTIIVKLSIFPSSSFMQKTFSISRTAFKMKNAQWHSILCSPMLLASVEPMNVALNTKPTCWSSWHSASGTVLVVGLVLHQL